MTLFIGCDPGVNGGLACLAGDQAWAVPMPADVAGAWSWFAGWKDAEAVALIEQVGGFVSKDQGRAGMGSSMFSFGRSVGALEMALTAAGIRWNSINPKTWQRMVGLKKEQAEIGTIWKGRLRDKAAALFPSVKLTLKVSDALLIAWCCKQLH
jgi:hypothetical protein